MPEPAPLHPVSRAHLEALSDEVGVMQHAIGSRPDPAHGYCTDDVARALEVDLLHGNELGWDAVADSAWRAMRFLEVAFDETIGRFRNFRGVDGSWVAETASEDSQGRAMLALGETIAAAPDAAMVDAAGSLFERALPSARGVTFMRAQASMMLGCDRAMVGAPSEATDAAYRLLADRLRSRFEPVASSPDWPWPEPRLTYENARPARALIVSGRYLDDPSRVDTGLHVLDWLIASQTAHDGHLSPVGNGWWPRDGEKARFDQQPIEATATLLAAESAHDATGYARYREAMEQSYAWFLGANDLGVDVADPGRGAGFDGLTPRGVNTNQGAESTLMWLTALEHIRSVRADGPSVPATPSVADQLLATSTP